MTILPILLTLALPQAAAPAAAPPAAPAAGKARDTIVCKRIAETGSLVRKRKICYSAHDWERIAWAARAGSQALQDGNMGRPISE